MIEWKRHLIRGVLLEYLFFPFLLGMQGNKSEERKNEDVSRVTKKGDQRLFISVGLNHPRYLEFNRS